ncbi:MAG: dienelactone hydrolase family protein [Fidelibacterota bacterium]
MILFLGWGTVSGSNGPNASTAGDPIVAEYVSYHVGDDQIQGYLARPADDEMYPAIIVIHEWWGLNDNIRENARQFARSGYVALAVDLYEGKVASTPTEARRLAGRVGEHMKEAFQYLREAVHYLKSWTDHVVPDRIASVGWCFGGGWSYQMAKNDIGVKVSVIYYGRFNPEDDLSNMRASILGHFAEEDRAIRVDSVREFQARLRTLSGNHEIFIYPNVGHAFANSTGRNYDREAAGLAWKRTILFLKRYL